MRKVSSLVAAIAIATGAAVQAEAAVPVIPGATGFGITTPAGRGGQVYKVTNLNASGSGSLRACAEASGPRVCVFEVSGTIKLTSDLVIRNPYLTIAGQTAPSPGITLRGASLKLIDNHDILIQHIRVRPGDDSNNSDPSERDAISIASPKKETYNIVLDHITATWALDETVQLWYSNVHDVTVSNSIMSEALQYHKFWEQTQSQGGGPGKGPIIDLVDNVAFVGNLMAHNRERNPLTGAKGLVLANNVIYNWNQKAMTIRLGSSSSKNSIVGNVFMRGGDFKKNAPVDILDNVVRGLQVYVNDNEALEYDGNDPWSVVSNHASFSPRVNSAPIWPAGFNALPASKTLDYVTENVGARPADRDSVDKRIINSVLTRTGRIIDSPADVGGYPDLAVNHRTLTLPSNPNGDSDGDGYTNLEEWLHEYAREVEGSSAPTPTAPDAPKNLKVDVVYK